MGYHPDTNTVPEVTKLSVVRSSLKTAVRFYAEDPIKGSFFALLAVIVVMLVLQFRVDWRLWIILVGLGAVRFHEWYRKEGYLSPLFGWLMLKIPQPVNRSHAKKASKKKG